MGSQRKTLSIVPCTLSKDLINGARYYHHWLLMLWTAMWHTEGKAWVCKRMVWCCHLQIWLIQIQSELPEENKELTACLYSTPWTHATEQVWPQQRILLFPQSTQLPPMWWISQLTKYDSRVKYMYFHIAWGQNTAKIHLTLTWRNDWITAAGKGVFVGLAEVIQVHAHYEWPVGAFKRNVLLYSSSTSQKRL